MWPYACHTHNVATYPPLALHCIEFSLSLSPFPGLHSLSAVNLLLSPKSRKCHKHRQQRVRSSSKYCIYVYKKNRSRAHIGPQGASGRGVSHLRQMQNNCIFIWAIGAELRAVPCQPARHCCSSCCCRCCSECCWDHKYKSTLRRPLMTFPKCANKQHDWRQRCSQWIYLQ